MKRAFGLALCALSFCTACTDAALNQPFAPSLVSRAQRAATAVETDRLRTHVEAMHAAHQAEQPESPTWGGGMTHTHHNSAAYVRDQFAALGYAPVVEHSDTDGLDVDNVYADIPGTMRADEYVLLSAHHDAWWQSGSDDNGSGVAVVLEAARVLRDSFPARTIRLVSFDREEEGLIGANRFATAHANDHIVMIVNMDCVGYASNAPDSQRAPLGLGLRSVGNFLLAVADEPAAGALSRFVRLSGTDATNYASIVGVLTPNDSHYPVDSSFLRSDHAPFWRQGVPGIFLTDTANFRNAHYHTPTDTPNTVDMPFLTQVARIVIGAVSAYAMEAN